MKGSPFGRFNGFERAMKTVETVLKYWVGNHPAEAGC